MAFGGGSGQPGPLRSRPSYNAGSEAGLGDRSGAEGPTTPTTVGCRLSNGPTSVRLMAQLRQRRAGGRPIAASCIGTFLLAEAGLLDHREATTTWSLAPFFRQRYPNVLLDESRMLVPTDVGVTAGAAMGHLDLDALADTPGESGARRTSSRVTCSPTFAPRRRPTSSRGSAQALLSSARTAISSAADPLDWTRRSPP